MKAITQYTFPNSSPKIGEVAARPEGSVNAQRGQQTQQTPQSLCDSSPKLGEQLRIVSLLTLFSVLCTLYSCTNESIEPSMNTGHTLTATASLPDNVATLGRALPGEATGLTLHYTAAKDDALTAYSVSDNLIVPDGESAGFSFSTGPALVWGQVKDSGAASGEIFYLTAEDSKGAPMWATASPQHGATNIAFGQMKYRKAAFTLNITLTENLEEDEPFTFTATLPLIPAAAEADITKCAWPTDGTEATATTLTAGTSFYLAPQPVTQGKTILTIKESNTDKTWTLDLSTVTVKLDDEGNTAPLTKFEAGTALTLTVRLSLTGLNTGSIEITDFTAATTGYTSGLGSTTNPGYTVSTEGGVTTYTVTNRYGLQAWLDAYAENSSLEIVVDIPDESTPCIDILLPESFRTTDTNYPVGNDGKTWAGKKWRNIVYLNSDGNVTIAATNVNALDFATQAAYDRGVSLVLTGDITERIYLNNNVAPAGSIDLILPDATVLPEDAFDSCPILRSVSAPKVETVGQQAFQYCTGLTAVDLPKATTIGNIAFVSCTALKSLELPSVTTLGDGVFSGVPLTSLTFGSVIESMGFTLGLSSDDAENCVLTLAAGQKQMEYNSTEQLCKPTDKDVTAAGPDAAQEARIWALYVWKEIIITPSTNE